MESKALPVDLHIVINDIVQESGGYISFRRYCVESQA